MDFLELISNVLFPMYKGTINNNNVFKNKGHDTRAY